ncbi:PEX14 [Candida jiufengensis]|uniref:PEX14 n=1 Tax=Candida jiufengensis TaxID=497108 RepID=UPI00222508E3|nr:PEX14 [Candida jiufengensis]KAI5954361.1 PEX14 [Candida jiufengensis]
MNDELINSAVTFLKDPNVASSPLTKKIEFLESKGLNQQEIEEALKRVNEPSTTTASSSSTSTSTPTQSQYSSQPSLPLDYYNVAPPIPERSWKDYFIMATATVGVTYGLYQVISKYLVPSIIPPSQSSIEQDKEVINEEFLKIDKILEQLTKEQEEIKISNEEKIKDIDTVIENINDFLTKYNKDKLKFDDDLRLMKLEVDNLSNSIEKNMRLSKENINDELSGLNTELQSLKNLIKIRGEQSQSSNGGASSRNIAPVSSIPSASDILKRAKAKAEEPKEKAASPEVTAAKPPLERSESITKGSVTAAGIPSWQLKHKEEEIEKEGSGALPNEEVVNNKIKSAGIPSWQLNSNEKKDIPSWQTNSST